MQARRKRLKDAGLTDYQVTVIIPIAHRDFVRSEGMQAELQALIKKHIEAKVSAGSGSIEKLYAEANESLLAYSKSLDKLISSEDRK